MNADSEFDDLVRAAVSGAGWAFGRLWGLLSPSVAGYARAHGVADEDDFTSEVFLAAFRSLPGFTGDGTAFRSWLFTIAHHHVVDDVRRRARRAPDAAYTQDADPRVVSSAEDHALQRMDTREVLALLDGLSADQREVLLLRLLGDLTIDQVGRRGVMGTARTPGGPADDCRGEMSGHDVPH